MPAATKGAAIRPSRSRQSSGQRRASATVCPLLKDRCWHWHWSVAAAMRPTGPRLASRSPANSRREQHERHVQPTRRRRRSPARTTRPRRRHPRPPATRGVRTATAAIAIGTLAIAEIVIYAAVKTLPEKRRTDDHSSNSSDVRAGADPRGHNRREAVGRALSATAMTALDSRRACRRARPRLASPARAAGPVGVGQLPECRDRRSGHRARRLARDRAAVAVHQLCRVPAGATVCDRTQALQNPGGDTVLRTLHLHRRRDRARAPYRGGAPSVTGLFLWTSSDGGSTSARRVVPDAAGPRRDRRSGGAISVSNDAAATIAYQRVPTDGSMVSASAGLTSTYNYQGTVGLVDANTPVRYLRERERHRVLALQGQRQPQRRRELDPQPGDWAGSQRASRGRAEGSLPARAPTTTRWSCVATTAAGSVRDHDSGKRVGRRRCRVRAGSRRRAARQLAVRGRAQALVLRRRRRDVALRARPPPRPRQPTWA